MMAESTHRTVVVALVLVQAEVKLSSMLNHRNIQRTQEHMILIVQFRNRHDKQSVILADAGQAGLRRPDRRAGSKAEVNKEVNKNDLPPQGVENTGGLNYD